jgi:hypothetical protein
MRPGWRIDLWVTSFSPVLLANVGVDYTTVIPCTLRDAHFLLLLGLSGHLTCFHQRKLMDEGVAKFAVTKPDDDVITRLLGHERRRFSGVRTCTRWWCDGSSNSSRPGVTSRHHQQEEIERVSPSPGLRERTQYLLSGCSQSGSDLSLAWHWRRQGSFMHASSISLRVAPHSAFSANQRGHQTV